MKRVFHKCLLLTILIMALSASTFGQCENQNGLPFKGKYVYWFKPIDDSGKKPKLDRLVGSDRILTDKKKPGEFQFTFHPESVKVIKNKEKIKFVPSLSRETTGDLYAIYYRVPDDSVRPPINANEFILPLSSMPADGQKITAKLRPFNYYCYKGNLIFSSPENSNENGRTKEVTVEKLNGLEMDVSNLEEGFYWFTLQGSAVFNEEQNPERYPKTTPPVLIEIRKKITPKSPTISLDVSIKDCELPNITAVARDADNEPNSDLPPQTLKLIWSITAQSGETVNYTVMPLGSPTSAVYSERININNLLPGSYNVKVSVTDGIYTTESEPREFEVKCSGAGIVYFQFDEPYDPGSKNGAKFNIENYLFPDEWGIYRSRRGQCSTGKLLPNTEFPLFYEYRYASMPPFVETNTAKLNTIGEFLRQHPDVQLYLLGYADFKNTMEYNTRLVTRRLEAVKQYLIRNYGISPSRLPDEHVVNKSNTEALSNDPDPCADGRMHDRRVELIYYKGDLPELPTYSKPYGNVKEDE